MSFPLPVNFMCFLLQPSPRGGACPDRDAWLPVVFPNFKHCPQHSCCLCIFFSLVEWASACPTIRTGRRSKKHKLCRSQQKLLPASKHYSCFFIVVPLRKIYIQKREGKRLTCSKHICISGPSEMHFHYFPEWWWLL